MVVEKKEGVMRVVWGFSPWLFFCSFLFVILLCSCMICAWGFFCSVQHRRNTYARSSKYKYIPVIIGTLTLERWGQWVGTRHAPRGLFSSPFFICKLQRWRLFILPSQSFYFTFLGFFFVCFVALVSGHCGEVRRKKPSGGITYYYLV